MVPEGVEEALGRYRSRATRTLLGGAVGVGLGVAVASRNEGLASPLIVFGVMAMVMGLAARTRTRRIRRLTEREGWRKRAASFRVAAAGRNGQPALLLQRSDTEDEAVVSVSTTVFRWGALEGSRQVWVTGNPHSRFAAVAPMDMRAIIVVKRPLMRWWARRLKRIASESA